MAKKATANKIVYKTPSKAYTHLVQKIGATAARNYRYLFLFNHIVVAWVALVSLALAIIYFGKLDGLTAGSIAAVTFIILSIPMGIYGAMNLTLFKNYRLIIIKTGTRGITAVGSFKHYPFHTVEAVIVSGLLVIFSIVFPVIIAIILIN